MPIYTHNTVPTEFIDANGIRFAYRRFGTKRGIPLVFFQHFMGNLDDHDPALTDAFAADREVILFNNAGVASSTGTTPATIREAARDAEAFIDALGLETIDLLAHSMGGLVGQQVVFDRPKLVRRLVLVGTGPRGGVGIGEMPPETQALFFKKYEHQEEMWLPILFTPSEASQAAGRAYLARMMVRKDRDAEVSMETVQAQAAAIAAYGAEKDETYAHLKALHQPTLVVNGNDDIIIPTINSYLLQQHAPNAQLILYPDANHGAHHQYPELFVQHTRLFLDAAATQSTSSAARTIKVPGTNHPITIERNARRVVVSVAGRVVADTRNALTLKEANYPAVQYIPRQDVDMTLLKRTEHATYCPYKGECAYYSIPIGGERAANAVWIYERPYDAVAEIKDHVAFYPDRVDAIEEL